MLIPSLSLLSFLLLLLSSRDPMNQMSKKQVAITLLSPKTDDSLRHLRPL